jgi:hypothetical protein
MVEDYNGWASKSPALLAYLLFSTLHTMPTTVHSTQVNRTELSGTYNYKVLPRATSFRVAGLLPGHDGEDIVCKLHTSDWESIPEYEAISYAWGDSELKASVVCDGKTIVVTQSLHSALSHFKYPDESRRVWADALW